MKRLRQGAARRDLAKAALADQLKNVVVVHLTRQIITACGQKRHATNPSRCEPMYPFSGAAAGIFEGRNASSLLRIIAEAR